MCVCGGGGGGGGGWRVCVHACVRPCVVMRRCMHGCSAGSICVICIVILPFRQYAAGLLTL